MKYEKEFYKWFGISEEEEICFETHSYAKGWNAAIEFMEDKILNLQNELKILNHVYQEKLNQVKMTGHVYYFPKINEIYIIEEKDFCDLCPHGEIVKWHFNNGFYNGIFLGEL